MNKRLLRILAVVLVLLLAVFSLAGCKSAGEKLEEEIAEGIIEKSFEGMTGGNADIEIEEGKWPSDMPKKVPEFKAGKIDGASSVTVAGSTQISVAVTGVKEKDYTNYAQALVKAGFQEVMTSNYSGTMMGSYQSGENVINITLDESSGEMIIGYMGNE